MGRTRIYFSTDIHGSTRCFKKFLATPRFYSANVLILGGDITGKALVPIIEQPHGGFRCTYDSQKFQLKNLQEVNNLKEIVADSGYYTCVLSEKEFEELDGNSTKTDELFNRAVAERVREWIFLADEKLHNTEVKCFISPGNDDDLRIDSILSSSKYVVNPAESVVKIDNENEMISLSHSTPTPWESPREAEENVLREKIERMTSCVKNIRSTIFNFHVPPINTLLDQTPKIDTSFKIVMRSGSIQMISAGSSACRDAIEQFQPMLGLHGHIHESRGIINIGRTMCVNPGSEYSEGILRGFIADLEGDKVKSYLLTSG